MIDINNLKQLKELLDMGAISQEEFEKQKQTLMQPEKAKKKKNVGLIVTIVIVVFVCFSIILGAGNETEDLKEAQPSQTITENSVPEEFNSECPVTVSSSMYDNIIGVPEIKCTFKNNTDKEIAAVKLYFVPRNVYGEDINSILATNELYTDNIIASGASCTRNWQLLDAEIKSGDVYVYSVYFSDGTEWGDKDASVSDIKKYAYKVSTKY